MASIDACWADIAGHAPFVMLGFNRRFDPSFREVRERVAAGEIGTIRAAADHQPRPAAAARGLSRRVRRHVPRHDHPRLRHGPLPAGRDRRGPGDDVARTVWRCSRRRRTTPRRSSSCARRPGPCARSSTAASLRLRLRPAPRGLRRPRLARGREHDRLHRPRVQREGDRGGRAGPQLLPRAVHARLQGGVRRVHRGGQGRPRTPRWALPTGVRPSSSPRPPSRAWPRARPSRSPAADAGPGPGRVTGSCAGPGSRAVPPSPGLPGPGGAGG